MAAVDDLKAMPQSVPIARSSSTLNLKSDCDLKLNLETKSRIPKLERSNNEVAPVVRDIWSKGRKSLPVGAAQAAEESPRINSKQLPLESPKSNEFNDELNISPNVEKLEMLVNTRRNTNFNHDNTLLDLDEEESFIKDIVPGNYY